MKYIQKGNTVKTAAHATRLLLLFLLAIPCLCCTTVYTQQKNSDFYFSVDTDKSITYPTLGKVKDFPIRQDGIQLPVPFIDQFVSYLPPGHSNLCWAADIVMISTYLGNTRSVCEVASYATPDATSCCRLTRDSHPADIIHCNKGWYPGSTMNRMGIYHLYVHDILPREKIQIELSNGRPVMLYIEMGNTKGVVTFEDQHVILITGFRKFDGYDLYTIHDSAYKKYELNYDELHYGTRVRQWQWFETWYHFSYRQDGCVDSFRKDC